MSAFRGRQFRPGNRHFSSVFGKASKRVTHQMAVFMLAEYMREDLSIVAGAFRENQADLLGGAFNLLAPVNGRLPAVSAKKPAWAQRQRCS